MTRTGRWLVWGLLAALCGCGGGDGGGQTNAALTGTVRVGVNWEPASQRLIPSASQAVRFELRQAGAVVRRLILSRPNATGELTGVPAGETEVRVVATPYADGTGVAQAAATSAMRIRAGRTNSLSVRLGSTVTRFVIAPSSMRINAGQTRQLYATAYDADNAVVPLPQISWQVTSGESHISVYSDAQTGLQSVKIDGWSNGTAAVRASVEQLIGDPETALAADATVQVGQDQFDFLYAPEVGRWGQHYLVRAYVPDAYVDDIQKITMTSTLPPGYSPATHTLRTWRFNEWERDGVYIWNDGDPGGAALSYPFRLGWRFKVYDYGGYVIANQTRPWTVPESGEFIDYGYGSRGFYRYELGQPSSVLALGTLPDASTRR